MSIEPIERGPGVSKANGVCDDCGRSECVPCDYSRKSGNTWQPDAGQVHRKLTAHGWTHIKNKLRCPSCEAKRKAIPAKQKEEEQMSAPNITQLRQPSPKQKREIIGILEDVYDDDNKRYRGHETDKTVAETIGGGVMPGWVAEIREDMFGPDGSNDEMEALLIEMREWVAAHQKETKNARIHLESAEQSLRASEDAVAKVAEFEKRVEAIKRNVGPKSFRA